MAIEQTIYNLDLIYHDYNHLLDDIDDRIMALPEGDEQDRLAYLNKEFHKFDVKLRLGLAVADIRLNDRYVREKMGDLKECHLMLYKLADIWFSYETYFRIHKIVFNVNISPRKVFWLDENTNIEYFENANIKNALVLVNQEFHNFFNSIERRNALKEYLDYCSEEANGGQKVRLEQLSENILPDNDLVNYSHTDLLSMVYAVRNNFAHNGEITVYPQVFGYSVKNSYLKMLYKYLVIVTIAIVTITIRKRLEELF